MSMSTARIPLLLSAAVAMNRSFVRPNPAVPEAERQLPKDFVERIFVRFVSSLTTIVSNISWISAIADTCIILHASRNSLPSSWAAYIDRLPFKTGTTPKGVPLVLAVGSVVAVAGVMIRRWAMATLGRHFTLELTLKPKHQLITAPPYNIVRHPSYTGGMMASLGAALAFYAPADGWFRSVWLAQLRSSDWPLAQRVLAWGVTVFMGAIFTLGTVTGVSRTTAEDRMLRQRFGKEWDRWAAGTPYKLLPFIY